MITETRGDLRPNPELDAILGVFYALIRDYPPNGGSSPDFGVFTVGNVLKGNILKLPTKYSFKFYNFQVLAFTLHKKRSQTKNC